KPRCEPPRRRCSSAWCIISRCRFRAPSFPGSAWERTVLEALPRYHSLSAIRVTIRHALMTRSRYHFFEKEYPYFITCTVVAWLPIFIHPSLVEIVLESWRFLQRERGIEIFGFVILENHLHWIASAKSSLEDLGEQVGRFKSFTARRIIDESEKLGFA